jgi:hypothetical protein
VAGNRGAFFQRRPNLAALLSAQRRELEPVLCSQCTNNVCRDHLSVAVRQRDFESYGFAQYESFSNECPQTTSLRSRDQPCRLSFVPSRWRRIQILVSNTCLGEIRSAEPGTSSEKGVAILSRSSSAHHRRIRKNTRERLRRAGPGITHGTAGGAETAGTH